MDAAKQSKPKPDWPEPLSYPQKSRQSTELKIDGLLHSPLLDKTRPALFSDTPQNPKKLPGNLHHASNEHIERYIGRMGAVALIKQLAEDLAQRDAQMTMVKRKAEENERVLKGMLRDLQVSNMDIEKRLSQIRLSTGPPQIDLDDLSVPPSPPADECLSGSIDLRRTQSEQSSQHDQAVRRTSVASLMKLVAGSNSTRTNADRQSRQKDEMTGKSRKTEHSNLGTLKESEDTKLPGDVAGGTTRGKRAQTLGNASNAIIKPKSGRHSLGPTGTIKGITRPTSPPERVSQSAQNLGPVEMETILPEGSRPPTLVHLSSNAELPTDRFGFIYGQRSKNGPTIVRSSQDSTNDTASMASVDDAGTPESLDKRAEVLRTEARSMNAQHDADQQRKTAQWNDFFRKASDAGFTEGETIGITGLGNKGKAGQELWKQFKSLVLRGIPLQYRPKIWAECSGALALRVPDYYQDLVKKGVSDPETVNQIKLDIRRTLMDNVFFREGAGVQKLEEVLLAYACHNPTVGYCQGMNFISAYLLLVMPTTEDAFWVLVAMLEKILPPKYFDHALAGSLADQHIVREYVKVLQTKLNAHLEEHNIELELLTLHWFLTVFSDCLAAEALFRVWDIILCLPDGSTFLFQLAISLLKLNEKFLLECDSSSAVHDYLTSRMMERAEISIDALIKASLALKSFVTPTDIETKRAKALQDEGGMSMRREPEVVSEAARARTDSPVSSRRSSGYGDTLYDEDFADMKVRTPMPLDEEVEWRG